jgi:hypothetical protein
LFLHFLGCKEGFSDKEPIQDNLPLRIQFLREGDAVLISLETEPGFGIQIEAPNRIEVWPTEGLEILSSDLGFKGSPNPEKPEYYQSLQPMNLTVKGQGILGIQGRVFYCDFNKNICLPGKLNRFLNLN